MSEGRFLGGHRGRGAAPEATETQKEEEKEPVKDVEPEPEEEEDEEETGLTEDGKTFNDLEPEFQWNSKLDPDHIFPKEYELIKWCKKEFPELESQSDKFILVFLIARRHNMSETAVLLKKFLKQKKDFGFDFNSPPSFTHDPLLVELRTTNGLSICHPINFKDKHDRMLRYYFMGTDNPAGRDQMAYKMMFWQTCFMVQTEPLSLWRNGIAIVVDLQDFGWKNMDMSSKGRAINRDIQGAYPFRLRAFYVVNGGSIISALVQAARLVVPRKIMQRMNVIETSQLQEHIPGKYLLKRYEGGTSDLDFDTYFRQVLEQEETLYKKGIWKRPE